MSQSSSLPVRGQALPEFEATLDDGTNIHIWDFRGRKNLALVFAGEQLNVHFRTLIHALGVRYREVQAETAEILAVLIGSRSDAARLQREAGLPFPVLPDTNGELHRKLGAVNADGRASAAICIADRYGEVYFAGFCDKTGCSSADDVLDWLKFIEIQCPECGVAEWPLAASGR